jgi:2-oxoglutarate ferredoxin oxidoreductase subunit delta
MMDRESNGSRDSKPNPEAGTERTAALPRADNAGEAPEEGLKKEYVIDIFRDWCKGCGICAEFCPKKCIKMNAAGEPEVVDAKGCTGCGWCELHCPDFAISVRECLAEKPKEEAD